MKGLLVEYRTAGDSPVAPLTRVSPKGPVLETPQVESPPASEVLAVVALRSDGTCVVYSQGRRGDWPSVGDAFNALGKVSPELTWRESTPGVWVARVAAGMRNENSPLASANTARFARAAAPEAGESYMAARVMRGDGTRANGHDAGRRRSEAEAAR